jgi:hypothetical protein
MKASQVAWIVSLAAFVCTALIGQAEMLAEPWRHLVSVIAIIATAISGFMVQHPWSGDERRQDTGPSYFVVRDGIAQRVTRDGFEMVLKDSHEQSAPQPLKVVNG